MLGHYSSLYVRRTRFHRTPHWEVLRTSIRGTQCVRLHSLSSKLGAFEASIQGAFILIGQIWYRRHEQGFRVAGDYALFLHSLPLAFRKPIRSIRQFGTLTLAGVTSLAVLSCTELVIFNRRRFSGTRLSSCSWGVSPSSSGLLGGSK